MAYTRGFRYDLFISYPMEAQRWAKQFYQDLTDETRLSSIGIEIYLASRTWELGEDSDEMLDAARHSALFVAVLTTDALTERSTRFLQLEMEAFRRASPLKRRFCPIPIEPIDSARLSELMPTANRDAFWNVNLRFFRDEGGVPLRLRQNSDDYKEAVERAAFLLRKRLDEIQSGDDLATGKIGPFAGLTVCLAPNAPDSNTEREWLGIRSLLVNDGANVVPSATPDGGAAISEGEFEAAVEGADLFVQLFDAPVVDHAKKQLEVVKTRRSNRAISILQWRKRPKERIDAAILQALEEEDRAFCEGACVQTGLLEDFKVAIRSKLQELKAAQNGPAPQQPPLERPYIYIAADTPDLGLARQLQKTARGRAVAVIMNEEEALRREDFESNLMLASGVVFVHGNAARRFVELWLNEFVKKTRLLGLNPKVTALYEAPPEKSEEEMPSPPINIRIEGSQREFTLAGIERICAELCGDQL